MGNTEVRQPLPKQRRLARAARKAPNKPPSAAAHDQEEVVVERRAVVREFALDAAEVLTVEPRAGARRALGVPQEEEQLARLRRTTHREGNRPPMR